MTSTPPEKQSGRVREMFSRIAPRYDLMNRLMTAGQDQRWRRFAIRQTEISPGGRLLDIGTGTGDLAREALRQVPDLTVVAADFTLPMMTEGRRRRPENTLAWTACDSLQLPFPNHTFDAVSSGFLLRNLEDLHSGLVEQHRVLKPGGKFVALDTTQPAVNAFTPLISFYLHTIIPWMGRALTGEAEAYRYLPSTTQNFLRAGQLTAHLAAAGFRKINYRRFMLGTVAVHWGEK